MTDAAKPSRWARVFPDVSAAAYRFPLAVLLAILYTAFNVFLTKHDVYQPVLFGPFSTNSIFLIASFCWVVAADLYVESHGRSWPLRIGLWLGGMVSIYLLVRFPDASWITWQLLVAAIVLIAGGAAYLCRGTSATYWLFNQRLWLGWVLAQIAATLLWLGLAAILGSLEFLFDIEIPSQLYSDIDIVAFGLIGTVGFLAFAPKSFDDVLDEGPQTGSIARALAVIVKFILVPLLLAYTTILYAYAVKIGLQGFLPEGHVAGMVVAYISVGAVTLLLAFPTRESGGLLVRFMWRYWLWLAVLPVLLLFLALYERVAAYGVTEDRYLLALAGTWILLLAAAKIVPQARFDVRFIPGLLAVLLLASSFGPWGARGLSVRSQTAQLATLLTTQGALVDGRLVANPTLDQSKNRAASLLFYLDEQNALHLLAPWFAGRAGTSPFKASAVVSDTYEDIAKLLGVTVRSSHRYRTRRFFSVHDPMVFDSANYSRVFGPIILNTQDSATKIDVDGFGTLQLDLTDGVLKLSVDDDSALRFDIADALDDLPAGETSVHHDKPIVISGVGKGLIGSVWLYSAQWRVRTERQETEITHVALWLGIAKSK